MNQELRDAVKLMVEELLDEGSKRDSYINRVVDGLKGPYSEYMKARYAELNEQFRQKAGKGTADGWDREADERLFDLKFDLARRLKNGDKRKAFDEAIDEFHDLVPLIIKRSCAHVASSFGLDERQMIDPPDSVTDDFFARVESLFDELTRK
jgi:hypothetical protein